MAVIYTKLCGIVQIALKKKRANLKNCWYGININSRTHTKFGKGKLSMADLNRIFQHRDVVI